MKKLSAMLALCMLMVMFCSCKKNETHKVPEASDSSYIIESTEISIITEEREVSEESIKIETSSTIEESEGFETSENAEESSFEEIGESTEESESFDVAESAEESVEIESGNESATEEEPDVSDVSEPKVETIPNILLWPQPEGEYHTLKIGETMQLYSQIEGSELEDAMLVWKVSDPKVISFSNKQVTALAEGFSTVTLSYSNGLKPVSVTFKVIAAEEELSEEE